MQTKGNTTAWRAAARSLAAAWALAACVALPSACNSDSNGSSATTPDCAITAVTLGQLHRPYTTRLADGTDTTYTATVTGAAYHMSIDQLNRRVFNVDSLPMGTNVKKIYFTTFAADGIVGYRLESGKDTLYNTKDTIDFTNPRIFTVYAPDGSGSRQYTVTINVHNAEPEAFTWQSVGDSSAAVAAMSDMRMLASGDTLRLWGKIAGQPVALTRLAGDEQWTRRDMSGEAELETSSITPFGAGFAAIAGGKVATSTDGLNWTATGAASGFDRILGTAGGKLYATAGGKAVHSDDAATWTADSLDGSYSQLPAGAPAWAVMPAVNNPSIQSLICMGYAESGLETWKKEINLAHPEEMPWSHYPITDDTPLTLPTLTSLGIVPYDSRLYAYGLTADTAVVYTSRDGARSWQKLNAATALPATIGKPSEISIAASGNSIYIACKGTGALWRGRLNRLAASSEK